MPHRDSLRQLAVDHFALANSRAEVAERARAMSSRVALLRLLVFAIGLAALVVASRHPTTLSIAFSVGTIATFVGLVLAHARIEARADDAERRRDVHERHAARRAFEGIPGQNYPLETLPPTHPYALDVDLVGPSSLVSRIDCTHTTRGFATLVGFLARHADAATIRSRQKAVLELAKDVAFREDLEAAVRPAKQRLDETPFLAFTKRPPLLAHPVARLAILASPIVVLALYVAARRGVVPTYVAACAFVVQALVAIASSRLTGDVFSLVAARKGYLDAFTTMLHRIEHARFEAPLLVALRTRIHASGEPPSRYMASLSRWANLAEFRTQFPLHFVVNVFTLYDLHVLAGLERWNRAVGTGLEDVFAALGEIEALSSFACLGTTDPDATFPEVDDGPGPLEIVGLAHPLLPPGVRVANDLTIAGPGHGILITGSNMAGKSTLLRATGQNLALALAGGPVIAWSFRCPVVRLRASMRVDDSLSLGASYFHAELERLRMVVSDLEEGPAVFFLLDELLRGTNADARSRGARGVLEHLLDRGGMGLTATHDLDLAKLEDERPGHVENRHFTDVMVGDEMRFDYILRSGVVRSSNALRLLSRIGIEVPDEPTRT